MNKIGIMIDEQPSLADEELCDNECKYFVKNRNVCIHVVLLFDDNISETDSYEYLFNISTDTATEVRLYMLYE